jgi:hypothetical protein
LCTTHTHAALQHSHSDTQVVVREHATQSGGAEEQVEQEQDCRRLLAMISG